ncbi:MFS general substrate transporter [Mycena sanguinolenta]|uniref:MFS general substrate transporter n=1 Tax=Mycena sanguinolenta TaxID=230812 RepID=A0A8H6YXV7_9AGAR|nr:MFS general substrate transporter [Mycena sanguinolenta]
MVGGFLPASSSSSHAAGDPSRWSGTPRVVGPSWTHLPVLTIGLLGVQIFWSVEMSYASPYLLSLGLSTSHVALVFLAGPLSGLVVQPLVGAYADTSTSKWGRRRPYILFGSTVCATGMLLLGYTRAVAGVIFERDGSAHGVLTIVLAVVAIFLIDFAINALMAVDRALLVDTLPAERQAAGNACAALMQNIGSVVGFFVGNLDLRTLLPFLHADSELQALSVLVSLLLLACHGLTAAFVRERVLLKTLGTPKPSLRHELREIYTHARALPSVIRQICFIQFFAWLGWFPVLFYTTMYITDIYYRTTDLSSAAIPNTASSPALSPVEGNIVANGTTEYPPARLLARAVAPPLALAVRRAIVPALRAAAVGSPLNATAPTAASNGVIAGPTTDADAPTRLGARAQLISAVLALGANALLPLIIPKSDTDAASRRALRNSRLVGRVDLESVGLSPIDAPGIGHSLANGASNPFSRNKSGLWSSLKRVGKGVGKRLEVPLPMLWAASHLVFAGCMVGSL